MNVAGIIKGQYSHQVALSEHRNEEHRAWGGRAVLFAEKGTATRVRNGDQRPIPEAGRNARCHGALGSVQVDELRGSVAGLHALQHLRTAALYVNTDAG